MNPSPAVFGEFGPTLAFAERTLSASLRRQLARRDTKPETWFALQLIATRGPRLARSTLVTVLAGSRNLEVGSTAEKVLARLEAEGLIRGEEEVDLTAAGQALHRSLREHLAGPTARLLSQFDIHDVETTVRTIQAITSRALEDSSPAAED